MNSPAAERASRASGRNERKAATGRVAGETYTADTHVFQVAPPGAETPIAICPPGPNATAGGKDTGISLQTDDIDAYHAQLKDRDVDVDAEVGRFGGTVPPLFWFRDPEGNSLMVVEVR
jgi:hypothetical protein